MSQTGLKQQGHSRLKKKKMSHLITWEQQVKSPKLQANVKLLYIKYTERNNTTLLSRHQVCLPIIPPFLLHNGTCFGPPSGMLKLQQLHHTPLISKIITTNNAFFSNLLYHILNDIKTVYSNKYEIISNCFRILLFLYASMLCVMFVF